MSLDKYFCEYDFVFRDASISLTKKRPVRCIGTHAPHHTDLVSQCLYGLGGLDNITHVQHEYSNSAQRERNQFVQTWMLLSPKLKIKQCN